MIRTILYFIVFLSLFSSCESKKEIGLQLYSIREDISKDLSGTLDAVADAGYTFVETAGYNNETGEFYGMEPANFTTLCNEKGLDFISSHTNGPDPNKTSIEDCMKWWEKAIKAHKKAGAPYIVQPAMHGTAYASLEGIAKYCELFNKVGELCNSEGVRFGYHNHAKEFTTYFETPDGKICLYDYMLENTKPENVFYQLDLYWIHKGNKSALDYFEKYPGRFEHWHVKDYKEIGASGKIDFEEIYTQGGKSGMKYQIVEQEAFGDGLTPLQGIKASFDYMKNAEFVK